MKEKYFTAWGYVTFVITLAAVCGLLFQHTYFTAKKSIVGTYSTGDPAIPDKITYLSFTSDGEYYLYRPDYVTGDSEVLNGSYLLEEGETLTGILLDNRGKKTPAFFDRRDTVSFFDEETGALRSLGRMSDIPYLP